MLQQRLESWGVPYVFSRPTPWPERSTRSGATTRCRPCRVPGTRHRTGGPATVGGRPGRCRRRRWWRWLPSLPRSDTACRPTAGRQADVAGGSSFGVDVVPGRRGRLCPGGRGGLRHDGGRGPGRGVPRAGRVLGGGARRARAGCRSHSPPPRWRSPRASQVYGTEEKYLHGSGVIHHTPMRVEDGLLHRVRHRAAEAYAAARHAPHGPDRRLPDWRTGRSSSPT